jgi:hypothetical protein
LVIFTKESAIITKSSKRKQLALAPTTGDRNNNVDHDHDAFSKHERRERQCSVTGDNTGMAIKDYELLEGPTKKPRRSQRLQPDHRKDDAYRGHPSDYNLKSIDKAPPQATHSRANQKINTAGNQHQTQQKETHVPVSSCLKVTRHKRHPTTGMNISIIQKSIESHIPPPRPHQPHSSFGKGKGKGAVTETKNDDDNFVAVPPSPPISIPAGKIFSPLGKYLVLRYLNLSSKHDISNNKGNRKNH